MYLMYIDESGDTIPLTQKGKRFLVLTGCILNENNVPRVETEFRKIKKEFFQDENIEIKSNFLRYANPNLAETSPLKLNSREKYNELEDIISLLLKNIDVDIFTIIIDKEAYWKKYPAQNPYNIAYVFLLERFQKFLIEKRVYGICIIDPREGQVEKHYMGNELSKLHTKMRWEENKLWKQCPNIIEKLLFSQSDSTIGIQLSDLYCYPIFNVFEYNKTKDEYWRFSEISYPKLVKKDGKVDGVGLKFFPNETKKDLRFYS